MKSLLIKNALLINEGKSREASVLVVGDTISTVYTDDSYTDIEEHVDEIIDASGKWLLPGVIDDQVHFREPGLTHKADINTESMAAGAGGLHHIWRCLIQNRRQRRAKLSNGNFPGRRKPRLPTIRFISEQRTIISTRCSKPIIVGYAV